MSDSYDVVVVGTGFASSFFLYSFLKKASPNTRILVLERGPKKDHQSQLKTRQTLIVSEPYIKNLTPSKPWNFNLSFGGGSNCWWACTPRFFPEDFELNSKYSISKDWPLNYNDLELYYCQAEQLMDVSGPLDGGPWPRSRPYPQPPHKMTLPDQYLKKSFPDQFFVQSTARPSQSVLNKRPKCCNNGVCDICPIDSKFTILNSFSEIYKDPRVTLICGAEAKFYDTQNQKINGLNYSLAKKQKFVKGDLFVLGANAIFNPYILQKSKIEHKDLGKYLNEQVSITLFVDLLNVENFQGSTSITANGYMGYPGEHRKNKAAFLVECYNTLALRNERGKWKHRMKMKLIFEDIPRPDNRVQYDPSKESVPIVNFNGASEYALKSIKYITRNYKELFGSLPVEKVLWSRQLEKTENHILGTTRMGNDPKQSIVDKNLVHHEIRNLVVVGGSVFPTSPPANPTLTICALSLRAGEKI